MVLVQYKPTRSVLLQLRRTRRMAERGHRLLKLKQDALIVEFFRVLDRAKKVRANLVDTDRAAEAYENLVEDVIIAAEIETTMLRLIEEIEKVKRRVNALEFRVIPELRSTEAFIRQRLGGRERGNLMPLKRGKGAAVAGGLGA